MVEVGAAVGVMVVAGAMAAVGMVVPAFTAVAAMGVAEATGGKLRD